MNTHFHAPGATGLYDPANEHDACGIALVAKLWGEASHAVVEKALDALENLEHRGAEGADPNTGDGAGILLQIPDGFLRAAAAGVELPPPGRYGVGVCYLPTDPERRAVLEQLIEETIEAEGQRALWWRDVPVDDRHVGDTARLSAPVIRQVLIAAAPDIPDQDAFERKLYVIRRVIERAAGRDLALPSFSSRTLIYKGMLTAPQLPRYFTDLRDPRVASRLALVHSRFSTNTFPSWELAHPYRMIAHNGEVNTLRGNVNWMRARESQLASELFGEDGEVKRRVARRQPYGEWYDRSVVHIDDLPARDPRTPRIEPLRSKQLAFGYSQEDLRLIIAPMASNGEEPVASMGNDAALAVMSDRQPALFAYFKQLFAQVTNPPIDPIRENVVMSLQAGVGAEVNLLAESPEHAHQLVMDQPIMRNHELDKLRQI